jgi:hypothetical protein
MVIIKIGADVIHQRELEIVNEKGDWANGSYHLFSAHFVREGAKLESEPHNIKSTRFLGELIVDKGHATWEYNGDKLNADEQKQVADFILDYSAPDGVY